MTPVAITGLLIMVALLAVFAALIFVTWRAGVVDRRERAEAEVEADTARMAQEMVADLDSAIAHLEGGLSK